MTISKSTMKLAEWNNAIMYRVACDCTDQDHDITLDLEFDPEVKMIFLNMYKKLQWSSVQGWNGNFFKEIYCRIKTAIKMLFTGYIEVESDFILREEQIDSFIEALEEGKRKLERVKEIPTPPKSE